MTLWERFWQWVRIGDGCWEWIGSYAANKALLAKHGGRYYGAFSIKDRTYRAHRVCWELVNGPIPTGLWVLHDCDNPPCVRPSHLFLGTHEDNVADKVAKGRVARASLTQTHCVHGHRFDEANVYRDPKGGRHCRECIRLRRAGIVWQGKTPNETILCACGCGESRLRFDAEGRERRFTDAHRGRAKLPLSSSAARAKGA